MRRLWVATESSAIGRGGISLVARATGVSRRAIGVGLSELKQEPDKARRPGIAIRQQGGGRKKNLTKDPALLRDLEKLVEPVTRGDPGVPPRGKCETVRPRGAAVGRRG